MTMARVDGDGGGSIEPLKGDPARQAVSTLRGYAYQIWRTLLAWFRLQPEEVLYIEGAEDFDVLRADGGETVQVKDLSRNVTLASPDVVEAIFHYWEHRANNPEHPPQLRLLTTAGRGREQGAPFGEVGGLDYWDRCRHPATDLSPLRRFLGQLDWPVTGLGDAREQRERLARQLSEFVANAPDDALRDQLVRPIHWDTGSDLQATVETLVTREAVLLGHRMGVQPSEATRAVDRLLRHVWQVASTRGERRLQYVDLLTTFEEVVTERVPRAELQHLRLLQTSALATLSIGHSTPALLSGAPVLTTVTALPGATVIPRAHVVAHALDVLVEQGVLVLSGSTGMGKSVLARLLGLRDGGVWRLLDLRGLGAEAVQQRLDQAFLASRSQPPGTTYVLDDLNFDERPTTYENLLAAFLDSVRSEGGRVVVTTHASLPEAVAFRAGLRAGYTFPVPPLEVEEVAELAVASGCPPGEMAREWGTLIQASTGGHPQLAHARVRSLEAQGWPAPDLSLAFRVEDIAEVQRQARQLLREQLPSADAHTLAYRLSIFLNPFRRQHALAMGDIPFPGDVFDRLVGPWVEPVNNGYFRVSPLLGGVAAEAVAPAQIPELHRSAAQALLQVMPLTQVEFGGLLYHGLHGQEENALNAVVMAAMTIPEERMPDIAANSAWFLAMGMTPGQRLFPGNPLRSFFLRRLQFAVALGLQSFGAAVQVASAWEAELDSYRPGDLPGGGLQLRMLFLGVTLIAMEVPFPLPEVVRRTAQVLRLLEEPDLFASLDLPDRLPGALPGADLPDMFVSSAVHRCSSAEDVSSFLEALAALPEVDARRILPVLDQVLDLPAQLLAKTVLASHPADAGLVEKVAGMAIDLGRTRGTPSLVAAAYRALAMVETDDRHDIEAALRLLAEGERALGSPHLLLEEYRARTMYAARRYDAAVQMWQATLDGWETDGLFLRAFGYRDAAAAAGYGGDWAKAAELAEAGEALLREVGAVGMAVGLRADRAFAHWKSGDLRSAVEGFAAVLDELPSLPSPLTDLRSYAVHKFVGHQILWALQQTKGSDFAQEDAGAEPIPGEASSPQIPEAIRELPLPPLALAWSLLADLERVSEIDVGIRRRARSHTERSRAPLVQARAAWQELSESLRRGHVENLVREVAAARWRALHLKRLVAEGGADTENADDRLEGALQEAEDGAGSLVLLGLGLLVLLGLGLLVVEAREGLAAAPLERWRSDLEAIGAGGRRVEEWFRLADPTHGTEADVFSALADPEGDFALRLAVAVRIAASSQNPDRCYYAHVTLFNSIQQLAKPGWTGDMEAHLEAVVVRSWRRLVEEARFALRSPRILVPAIQEACEDPGSSGMVKVARVLLAAGPAVSVRVPAELLSDLREVAGR